jgi:arylsulfatase A-like enzyme
MPLPAARPNILVILADDLGFSDLGCFGAEIPTPRLDALAAAGTRMTSFYNVARCCPSRACLLTGLHPHQAGIGAMTEYRQPPAYSGYLLPHVPTLADALSAAGYRTWLAGKWHVGGDYAVHRPETWLKAGDERHPLPTQRGFQRFYGTLGGAGSYFLPPQLMDQESYTPPDREDYYYTDALSRKAVEFIDEASAAGQPFFGYLAYTAPHWPLHAPEAEIAPHRGRYRRGWDALRAERLSRMTALGIVEPDAGLSARDESSHPWEDEPNQAWEDERMAVYAAQVTAMDRGIGEVVDRLKQLGAFDDTLIVFLSDNGGCAEFLREDGWHQSYALPTRNGSTTRVGNRVGRAPGPENTFMSYGLPWANASNTPFRKFKAWTHEGGISTPFIASWPRGGIPAGRIERRPAHLVDLAATALAAAGAERPSSIRGLPAPPPEGVSLLPLLRAESSDPERLLCWEHLGHAAARRGEWKIVRAAPGDPWELYRIAADRIEQQDLAAAHPEMVADLVSQYDAWATRVGVA